MGVKGGLFTAKNKKVRRCLLMKCGVIGLRGSQSRRHNTLTNDINESFENWSRKKTFRPGDIIETGLYGHNDTINRKSGKRISSGMYSYCYTRHLVVVDNCAGVDRRHNRADRAGDQ